MVFWVMVKRAPAIIGLVMAAGMTASGQTKTTVVPGWLTDTLFKLPEVKKEAEYIDSASHQKRHLTILAFPEEKDGERYWHAEVCEDNGMGCVAYFHFYCWSKTRVLNYYDPEKGKLMSLAAWRKLKPSWHER